MAFEAEKPSHLKQVCSTIVLAVVAIALPALFAGRLVGAPMGTALTYQGQLQQSGSGNITGQPQSGPVTGICDFRFSLWDAVTNGNLVGATQTVSAVSVSNGLFTVTLDFGAGAFNGDARWLDIGVRTNGGGAFTNLFPRQLVPLAPYALYAAEAGSVAATNFIGIVPDAQLSSNVALLNGNANFIDAVTAASFAGNGSGLTNLNAANLTGILPLSNLNPAVVTNRYGDSQDTFYISTNGVSGGSIFLGIFAGNFPQPESFGNIGIGGNAMRWTTTNDVANIAIGNSALQNGTNRSLSIGIGGFALYQMLNGRNVTALGFGSGGNVLSATNSIYIGNAGADGDYGVIRIGQNGTNTDTYIAGIIHGNGSGLTNVPGIGSATNAINNNNGVGTNLTVYGTLTSTNLNALYDTNNAGIAAALVATNNFGTTVPVNLTNATNQFTGTFTNGTYYGNGEGLTNLAAVNIVGALTNNAATATYAITAGTATNSPLGLFGSAATNSASAFDTNNAGIAAALAATNAMGQSSGLAAFQNTNFFDLSGAGTAAALAATNNFGRTVVVNMTNTANSFTGNGGGLTNLTATNLVSAISTWSVASNTLALNNGDWFVSVSGNGAITNCSGAISGLKQTAFLTITNSSASSINFYWTAAGSATADSVSPLSVPAGKVGWFWVWSNGTTTNYYNNVSQ